MDYDKRLACSIAILSPCCILDSLYFGLLYLWLTLTAPTPWYGGCDIGIESQVVSDLANHVDRLHQVASNPVEALFLYHDTVDALIKRSVASFLGLTKNP